MPGPRMKLMFNQNRMKKCICGVTLTFLFCAPAFAQQQSQGSGTQALGTETPTRVPLHSPDIISDNLDRVAASADQILEVVSKEAGLMVELSRI